MGGWVGVVRCLPGRSGAQWRGPGQGRRLAAIHGPGCDWKEEGDVRKARMAPERASHQDEVSAADHKHSRPPKHDLRPKNLTSNLT